MDDELVAEAEATAAEARGRAGIVVRELVDHQDAAAAARLLDAVWGRPAEAGSMLGVEALVAIDHAGGQISVAVDRDDRVVAATAAWLGRDHADGSLFLHSHATGVVDGATGRGIGQAMKWHQRAWALARGLAEVRWTFDPLVRRNAVLNLTLLGAGVRRYEQDLYGPMADARNRGLPTDRLEASWSLTAPRVIAAAAGRAAAPDPAALQRSGAVVVLQADGDTPVVTGQRGSRELLQIPADIESLRREDPTLAARWSSDVRGLLAPALADGGRITGMTRDGWYVVSRGDAVRELTGAR